MEKAGGAADAEMSIIQESWQYKLNALKQTWVGILQEMIDRGQINDLLDKLIRLSEILGNVAISIGPFPSLIAALGLPQLILHLDKIPEILDKITGTNIIDYFNNKNSTVSTDKFLEGFQSVPEEMLEIGEEASENFSSAFDVKAAQDFLDQANGEQLFKDAELDNVPLEFEVKPFDAEDASKTLSDIAKDGAIFKDIEDEAEKTVETVNRTFGGINLDETYSMLDNLSQDNPFDELTDAASMEVKRIQDVMDGEYIQIGHIDTQAVEADLNAIKTDVFGTLPDSAKDSVTQTIDVLDDLAAQDWNFGVGDAVVESMDEVVDVVDNSVDEAVDKLHKLADFDDWNFGDTISDAIDTVSESVDEIVENVTDIEFDLDIGEIEAGTEAVSEFTEQIGDVSTDKLSEELEQVGSSAEIASAGLGALKNIAINVGLTMALGALVKIITDCAMAESDLRKEASKLSTEFDNTAKSIDNYKKQIDDLKAIIDDANSSYDDTVQARKDLLEIQDTLIDKYGTEAENIDLVTEAIRNQTDALDELKAKKWQETLNEINTPKGFLGLGSKFNNIIHDSNSNLETLLKQFTDINDEISFYGASKKDKVSDSKILTQLADKYKSLNVTNGIGGDFFTLSGNNLEEVYQELLKIQAEAEKLGASDFLNQKLSDLAINYSSTISSYGNFFKQYLENEVIMKSPELAMNIDGIEQAAQKYRDAFTKQDPEEIKASADEFIDIYNKALASAESNPYASSLIQYIKDMYPEIKSEIDKFKIKEDIEKKIDEAFVGVNFKKDIERQLDELERGGNVKLKVRPVIDDSELEKANWGEQPGGKATVYTVTHTNEDETVAMNFTPIITDANGNYRSTLSPSSLQKYAEEVIAGVHTDYLNLKIGATFYGDDAIEKAEAAAQKIHELHEQYYLDDNKPEVDPTAAYFERTLRGLSVSDLTDNFNQLDAETQNAFRAMLSYFKLNEDEADVLIAKLIELGIVVEDIDLESKGSIKFDQKGFAEAITKAQKLSKLYKTWVQQVEDEKPKVQLDISEVEGLREDFTAVVGEDEFDAFEQIVTDANSTKQQVQEAFDNMITTFINKEIELKGASAATASSIVTQIEDLGLMSSETQNLVNNLIIRKEIEQELQQVVSDGGEYSRQRIQDLANEASELGVTGDALLNYIKEMMIANNLSLGGDDSWLIQLCKDLGIAVEAIDQYKAALNSASGGTVSEKISNLENQAANYAMSGNMAAFQTARSNIETLKGKTDDLKTSFDFEGAAAEIAGKKTGGAGKEADKAADKVEELAKQLDDLKNAYEALRDITDTYNKAGKISAEQYKKLINLDFRYIAALKKEGNAIKVDEKALEGLQEAEVAAAKAELYNRLATIADTIAKMSEAEVTAYLAQVNISEAATAYDVAKAALMAKIALLEQGSAAHQLAAEMLNAAVANAEFFGSVIGGYDFDPSSLGEGAGEAAEEMEDEFEKVFDWMERKIQLLEKKIEYYNAKLDLANDRKDLKLLDKQANEYKKKLDAQLEAEKVYAAERDKYMAELPADIQDKILNGSAEIVTLQGKENEELADTIDKAIEWHDKMLDVKTAALETKKALNDITLEKIERFQNIFDKKKNYQERQISAFEAIASKSETHGNFVSGTMYKRAGNRARDELYAYKNNNPLLNSLDAFKKGALEKGSNLTKGSDAWTEASGNLMDMATTISETANAVEEYHQEQIDANKALRDFKLDLRRGYREEVGNVRSLMNEEDAFVDRTGWGKKAVQDRDPINVGIKNPYMDMALTTTGYAMLGADEMQRAMAIKEVEAYTDEMKQLKKLYDANRIGEEKYIELTKEASDAMYESAQAAQAAEDAMVSLYREGIQNQIDLIKEELEAYKELINKQKEELQAEKKLHDYRKQTRDTNRSIVKLERQLAAIAGDNSIEGQARQRKLNDELKTAQENRQEQEYNRAMEAKTEALDNSIKQLERETSKRIENLEALSRNRDMILEEVKGIVESHPTQIKDGFEAVSDTYKTKLSDPIEKALKEASKAETDAINGSADTSLKSVTKQMDSNITTKLGTVDDHIKAETNLQKAQAHIIWEKIDEIQNYLAAIHQLQQAQKKYDEAVAKHGEKSEQAQKALDNVAKAEEKVDRIKTKIKVLDEQELETYGITDEANTYLQQYKNYKNAARYATSDEEFDKYQKLANEAWNKYSEQADKDFYAGASANSLVVDSAAVKSAETLAAKAAEEHTKAHNDTEKAKSTLNDLKAIYHSMPITVDKKTKEVKESKERIEAKKKVEDQESIVSNLAAIEAEKLKVLQDAQDQVEKAKKTKYRKSDIPGYAKGVHNLKKDQIAWTQEYGAEAILSPTRNSVLVPLKSHDTVLTPAQTDNLFKLAKLDINKLLGQLSSVATPSVTPINSSVSNVMNIETLVKVEGDISDNNVQKIQKAAKQAVEAALTKLRDGIH